VGDLAHAVDDAHLGGVVGSFGEAVGTVLRRCCAAGRPAVAAEWRPCGTPGPCCPPPRLPGAHLVQRADVGRQAAVDAQHLAVDERLRVRRQGAGTQGQRGCSASRGAAPRARQRQAPPHVPAGAPRRSGSQTPRCSSASCWRCRTSAGTRRRSRTPLGGEGRGSRGSTSGVRAGGAQAAECGEPPRATRLRAAAPLQQGRQAHAHAPCHPRLPGGAAAARRRRPPPLAAPA
jgi:hypothetical protein